MASDFQIEDLISQNEHYVVYRAQTHEGVPLALIRLNYEEETLKLLKEDRFDRALKGLQSLNHNCLRPILHGGLDPVDSFPWIAVRWWEGSVLSDRLANGPLLTLEEFERIKRHGSALVESLGPLASTISFTPSSVVSCGSDSSQVVDTFSVDYHAWFHAFAQDIHPASLSPSSQKLNHLLELLKDHTANSPPRLITTAPAPAAHSAPPNPLSPLPSAQGQPFPFKKLLFSALLISSLGGIFWSFSKKRPQPPSTAPTQVQTETQATLSPPLLSPVRNSSSNQKTQKPAPSALRSPESEPSLNHKLLPERPKLDFRFVKIKAGDFETLQKNTGKWVQISGEISPSDQPQELVFKASTLRGSLPHGAEELITNALGNAISVQGFLESSTLLHIPDKSDLQITYSPKELYTVSDEAQLRKLKGSRISLRAEAVDFTTSSSKATLYLLLHHRSPQFAIGFQKSKLDKSLDENFIRSLIGKKITFEGPLRLDARGARLSIVVTKKSQIIPSE